MTPLRLAWFQILRHPVASLLLVISLGCALAAGSLATTVTSAGLRASASFTPPYDAIIGPKSESLTMVLEAFDLRHPSEDVIPRAMLERISQRLPLRHVTGFHVLTRHEGAWVLAVDPTWWEHPDPQRQPELVHGRAPQGPTEAVIGAELAQRRGLTLGRRLTLRASPSEAQVQAARARRPDLSFSERFDPAPAPFLGEAATRPMWEQEVEIVGIVRHDEGRARTFDHAILVGPEVSWSHQDKAFGERVQREVSRAGALTYILVQWRDPEIWSDLQPYIHHGSTAQLVHAHDEVRTLQSLASRSARAGQMFAALVLGLAFVGVGVLLNARFDRLLPHLGLLRALGYRSRDIARSIGAEAMLIAVPAVALSALVEGLAIVALQWGEVLPIAVSWPSAPTLGLWLAAPLVALVALAIPWIRLRRADLRTLLQGL